MMQSLSRKSTLSFLVCGVLFLSYSCKQREILISDQSQDLSFFPVEKGFWVEYEVDSVVHYDSDDAGEVDTAIGAFHFYVREEIDSSYFDGENKKTNIILRYRRVNDSLPWTFMNLWTANVTPYSVQRVEDNIRFVRLKFPITSESIWEGNAFNFFPKEDYSYDQLFQPRQYNNMSFDSTITVIQNDFLSRINKIYKKEIYGTQAGLLFKQIDSVNTKNTMNGTIILNGLEYKLSITDYKH